MEDEQTLAAEQDKAQARPYFEPAVLVASSLASISARLCTHPLDTIRIRIQTAGYPVPPIKELVPRPRIRSLYAGLPVAIGFSVPALSVYLSVYEASKRYFSETWLPQDSAPGLLQQLPVFVAAGTAAEFASGAIWTPLDVLKSRLQTGREGTSAVALTRKILHEEGAIGLMKGYWLGTAIFVPNIAIYWSVYESLKQRYIPGYSPHAATTGASPDSPSPASPSSPASASTSSLLSSIPVTLRYTVASVTACSIAACITTPIEVVQARWQTSGVSGKVARGGISGIVKTMWRREGARAFTRGLGIRIAYAIPANGISMTVYESVKRYHGLQ
ncbi:hypothetical protein JCM9279_004984 [Rhodotorula babjevae]